MTAVSTQGSTTSRILCDRWYDDGILTLATHTTFTGSNSGERLRKCGAFKKKNTNKQQHNDTAQHKKTFQKRNHMKSFYFFWEDAF